MDEMRKLIRQFAEKVARASDAAFWASGEPVAERFYAAITAAADDLYRSLNDE